MATPTSTGSKASQNDEQSTIAPPSLADSHTSEISTANTLPERKSWSLSWLIPSMSRLSLCCMVLHFLMAFSEMILVAPQVSLFEHSLCWSYYQAHDPSVIIPGGVGGGRIVDESLCKIPPIQADLATIRGWKATFDTLPVILVAIPTGRLGDRYGRKKILAITLFGVLGSLVEILVVCAFPQTFKLQYVWLSSVVLLAGGGLYSCAALMWALASQATSEERGKSFYYIFSAFYMAELVASLIASATIDISPWIPCGLAIASLVLALLLLFAIPESRSPPIIEVSDTDSDTIQPLLSSDSDDESPERSDQKPRSVKSALAITNIRLIIPVFLVGCLRYTMLNILIQYAHIRFNWKISRGAMFYSETAIVNTILFSLLVPQISTYVQSRYNISTERINLTLVRASVSLMGLGMLLIGIAGTDEVLLFGVAVFASGFGSRVSSLSLVSFWIDDSVRARLFASISVLENIGHAIGDPTMQNIFASTLTSSSAWLTLPFFTAAAIYGIAILSSSFIRLNRTPT